MNTYAISLLQEWNTQFESAIANIHMDLLETFATNFSRYDLYAKLLYSLARELIRARKIPTDFLISMFAPAFSLTRARLTMKIV